MKYDYCDMDYEFADLETHSGLMTLSLYNPSSATSTLPFNFHRTNDILFDGKALDDREIDELVAWASSVAHTANKQRKPEIDQMLARGLMVAIGERSDHSIVPFPAGDPSPLTPPDRITKLLAKIDMQFGLTPKRPDLEAYFRQLRSDREH